MLELCYPALIRTILKLQYPGTPTLTSGIWKWKRRYFRKLLEVTHFCHDGQAHPDQQTVKFTNSPPTGYGQFTAVKKVSADQFHVAVSRELSTRASLLALTKFIYFKWTLMTWKYNLWLREKATVWKSIWSSGLHLRWSEVRVISEINVLQKVLERK